MTYADIAGNRYPVVRMPDGNDWIASDLRYGQLATDKVHISRDGGLTWDNASQLRTFHQSDWLKYVYDSIRHRIIGVASGGVSLVIYSDDGGVTWNATHPTGSPPNAYNWDGSHYNHSQFYGLYGQTYCHDIGHDSIIGPLCYRSLDGGITWSFPTTIPDGFMASNQTVAVYDYANSRIIVACDGGVYPAVSTDGGDTYVPFVDSNTGGPVYSANGITLDWYNLDWSCGCYDPYHNTTVLLTHAGARGRGMVISGDNYKLLCEQVAYVDDVGVLLAAALDFPWRSLCFDSNRKRLVAVGDGGSVYSDDGGYTWTNSSLTKNTWWEGVIYDPEHDTLVASSLHTAIIATSIDGGITWSYQQSLTGDNGGALGLIYDEHHKVIVAGTAINADNTLPRHTYQYNESDLENIGSTISDGWIIPSESDVARLISALNPKPALKLKDQYPDNIPTLWSPYPNAGTEDGTYSKDVYGFRAVPYRDAAYWWTSEGTLFGITHSGDNITTKSAPNGQESPIRLMRSGTWTRPVAEAPSATPEPGTYYTPQDILLSSPSGFSIYYTTDGSAPSELSQLYISSVPVSATTIIKAISTRAGYDNSQVAAFGYTIQEEQPIQAFVIPSKPSVQFYNFYSKRFDVY